MDFQRLFLYVAAMFLGLMVWQTWTQDYGPKPVIEQPIQSGGDFQTQTQAGSDVPSTPSNDVPEIPSAGVKEAPVADAGPGGKLITARTDLLEVTIDTQGGVIRDVRLLAYPLTKDHPEVPFQLLGQSMSKTYIAQSGLISDSGKGADHRTEFHIDGDRFELGDRDSMTVTMVAEIAPGLVIEKVFEFRRDSYLIDIGHRVRNSADEKWSGRQYTQLQKTEPSEDEKSAFIYTYDGAAIYSEEEKYEKISYDDMRSDPLNRVIRGGWAAFIQHYFVGALVPRVDAEHHYYAKRLASGRYSVGMISEAKTASSSTGVAEFKVQAFLGPKEQDRMAEASQGLELSTDYGYLTFIAQPLFHILSWIHAVVPNWGWAIILLTVLIKLVFFKLSEKSYRSMARMRKLTPKIQSMKERYGDDKQRMQQAMMDMYKKEKVNPLGGCWPMMVQIPVFIALYWVLLESVEMRQAPWILWIDDLSTKDPYFVLPLVMGVSMFIQQKLNPAPPDPVQAKVMMALPFIFTVFFAFFPSGLVLYWVVNNILSISQQYVITKRIEAEDR
ncbi:MAG: membrane protein insertase YidC [Gammaproteobacteria bacterium]